MVELELERRKLYFNNSRFSESFSTKLEVIKVLKKRGVPSSIVVINFGD